MSQSMEELQAIAQRFRTSLGEGPFCFMIGNTRHCVMRIGLARRNNEHILIVTGLPASTVRAHVPKEAQAKIDSARDVVVPRQFEGLEVDLWSDE